MNSVAQQEKQNAHIAQRNEHLTQVADYLDSNPNAKEHSLKGTRLKRPAGFISPDEKFRFRGYAVLT